MARVVVTNGTAEAFVSRFDGVLYTFEPGVGVPIPVEAAAFFFGFGLPEAYRERLLVRNGWLKTSDDSSPFGPKAAQERLRGFVFRKAAEEPRKVPKAIDLPARPAAPLGAAASAQPPSGEPQPPSGGAPESEAGGEAEAGATAAHPVADPPASPLAPAAGDQGMAKRAAAMVRGVIGLPKGSARGAIGLPPR